MTDEKKRSLKKVLSNLKSGDLVYVVNRFSNGIHHILGFFEEYAYFEKLVRDDEGFLYEKDIEDGVKWENGLVLYPPINFRGQTLSRIKFLEGGIHSAKDVLEAYKDRKNIRRALEKNDLGYYNKILEILSKKEGVEND